MTQIFTINHLEQLNLEELSGLHHRLLHEAFAAPRHSIERINALASLHNVEIVIAQQQAQRLSPPKFR